MQYEASMYHQRFVLATSFYNVSPATPAPLKITPKQVPEWLNIIFSNSVLLAFYQVVSDVRRREEGDVTQSRVQHVQCHLVALCSSGNSD